MTHPNSIPPKEAIAVNKYALRYVLMSSHIFATPVLGGTRGSKEEEEDMFGPV